MEIDNLNKADEVSPLLLEWLNQFSDEFIDQAKDQDELPIQLTNITGTNLQQINDDCLLKIFKSLSLIDLCSIAKTCERFQQIAVRVFPKEFSISKEREEDWFVIALSSFSLERRKRKEVERILRTFGFCPKSSLPKLEQFIYGKSSYLEFIYRHLTLKALHLCIKTCDYRCNQQMLQTIGNNCKELEELLLRYHSPPLKLQHTVASLQPLQSLKLLRTLKIKNVSLEDSDFFSSLMNLEKLEIYNSKIPKILTRSKPIFKRLQLLKLYNYYVEDWTLFAQCDSLVELELSYMSNVGSNVFPKLERFTYDSTEVDMKLLFAFISRHKSLKTLVTIADNCSHSDTVMILQEIGNSCKKLEELRIMIKLRINLMICGAAVEPLKALKSLRKLQLYRVTFEDFEFFSSLTNLRELHLYSCDLPEKLEQFDFLVQLTKLKIEFKWNPNAFDVVGIISRLTKLEEFTTWPSVLDEMTFSRIVAIVKTRPNVLTLRCNFNFDLENFDQNESVRLIKTGLYI